MFDHLLNIKNHSQSSDLIGKYDKLKENLSFVGEGKALGFKVGALNSKDLSSNCRCVGSNLLGHAPVPGLQFLDFLICQIKVTTATLLDWFTRMTCSEWLAPLSTGLKNSMNSKALGVETYLSS